MKTQYSQDYAHFLFVLISDGRVHLLEILRSNKLSQFEIAIQSSQSKHKETL